MGELEKKLQAIADRVNADKKAKDMLRKWVDTFNGKIIMFKIKGGKSYTISFTSEEAWVQEGEYPSPDLIFEGDENTLLGILSKEKISFSKAMKTGELMAYGNLNEAYPFGGIVKAYLP